MVTRKQLDKLNSFQVLLLALLRVYIAICIDLLIATLVIGLCDIVYPILY